MPGPTVVLHQFRASHFNDKARWALAAKGIRHERVTYLPGPLQFPIKRLSGQTATPVLVFDGTVTADPQRMQRAFEATRRNLDWIAEATRERPYLAGDAFSVADLTAAALLAQLVSVDHPDMRKPEPQPLAFARLLDEWKDHPASAWVCQRYRVDRPTPRT